MIVKEHFAPHRVLPYVRADLAIGAVAGTATFLLVDVAGLDWLALPTTLATVLGVALSILLAFRANAAYQRWWDAAGVFAQIAAGCRTFARTVVALAAAKRAAGVDPAAVDTWEAESILRQIAWVHAVRLERTAWVNETPFENRITDVPLDAITTSIERDLLELLREPHRPALLQPADGYLW